MTFPWPTTAPTADQRRAYAGSELGSYWLSQLPPREPAPPLPGDDERTDLLIVGGGFTGLWTALHAKAADPGRDVTLLEAATIGSGASGRNGGFADRSLTHGTANGIARFADEIDTLERLAAENWDGFLADIGRHGIDCDLERTGELLTLLEPYQLEWVQEELELARRFGRDVEALDEAAMRAEVRSPLYLGGIWTRDGAALLDPAKLALGLHDAAVRLGVRVHERSEVEGVRSAGEDALEAITADGRIRARRVVLATSAYRPLLRAMRRYIAPVYDYVLVTEPLDAARRESLGWRRRQGLADGANQFHYYRLTADDRVLYGGYDAVYRWGGTVGPARDEHDPTFARLSQHFFTTFPQLEGVRFTHRWGGAIDTCSRFSAFFGTSFGGRLSYVAGYTGLGVAASRFGASVALDLVDGRESEATRLRYVRSKPVPFPPEPLRTAVIGLTRNRLAAADRRQGRRGAWLRALDRLGLGFDS